MSNVHPGSLLPVLVITGYLGAGKSTLIKRLLAEYKNTVAVVNNEIGGASIEEFSARANDTTVSTVYELGGGCLCCDLKDSLIERLTSIAKYKEKLKLVVIETTGLATPGPVVEKLVTSPPLGLRLLKIITVVDAVCFRARLQEVKNPKTSELIQQIVFADVVIVNKSDLVTSLVLSNTIEGVRAINALCSVISTVHCEGLKIGEELFSNGLNHDDLHKQKIAYPIPLHQPFGDGMCTCTLTGPYPTPSNDYARIKIREAQNIINAFTLKRKNRIYRSKGEFIDEDASVWVLQGVCDKNNWQRLEGTFSVSKSLATKGNQPRFKGSKVNKLVLIGRLVKDHIDELRNALLLAALSERECLIWSAAYSNMKEDTGN